MSLQNERDPRMVLAREKYFTLRPKPLERWLWNQAIPQAAERVFWLHWEEGMRRGDWCSEVPLKRVARECCVDVSTVTRAYQVLKKLALIRREDPGRDPNNPFLQATAVTEVRVPKDLLVNLSRAPDRPQRHAAVVTETLATEPREGVEPRIAVLAATVEPARPKFSRAESSDLMKKLTVDESREFFRASRDRRTAMTFDAKTRLTPEERGRVLELLTQISSETPKPLASSAKPTVVRAASDYARPRQLATLEAARLRKNILQLVPSASGSEVFRQVLWSMEEGALRRFDSRLAANIALKKIREGAWSRPNRMPPNWLSHAAPETCTAA